MADALDAACKKVDDLIMGDDASKLRVDPDDPWAEIWDPPRHVYKERCAKTGYLMTKPFERHNPMPGQFDQTSDYIVRMLKFSSRTRRRSCWREISTAFPGATSTRERSEGFFFLARRPKTPRGTRGRRRGIDR